MNKPAVAASGCKPTGWFDANLAEAYFQLEAALKNQAQSSESPITEAIKAALDAVEAADVEIEQVSK